MRAAAFNYQSIADAAARARLQAAVEELRRLDGRMGADTLAMGKWLIEIQAIVTAAQASGWTAFARRELGMSPNTCTRLMKAYRVFGQLDCAERFQRTALYELAADYVPQKLRDEAIKLARGGARVAMPTVAELLATHQLVRAPKRLAAVPGLGLQTHHVVRSALKRAFAKCQVADRLALAQALKKLVDELLAECIAPSPARQAAEAKANGRSRPAAFSTADVAAAARRRPQPLSDEESAALLAAGVA